MFVNTAKGPVHYNLQGNYKKNQVPLHLVKMNSF